jgi:hypothetical protein
LFPKISASLKQFTTCGTDTTRFISPERLLQNPAAQTVTTINQRTTMDPLALASTMKRLAVWLDRNCQPDGFIQQCYDGASAVSM